MISPLLVPREGIATSSPSLLVPRSAVRMDDTSARTRTPTGAAAEEPALAFPKTESGPRLAYPNTGPVTVLPPKEVVWNPGEGPNAGSWSSPLSASELMQVYESTHAKTVVMPSGSYLSVQGSEGTPQYSRAVRGAASPTMPRVVPEVPEQHSAVVP